MKRLATLLLALLLATPTMATVPSTISCRNHLLAPGGPAAGSRILNFSILDQPSGGSTPLWADVDKLGVVDALSSAQLGASTPLPATVLNTPAVSLETAANGQIMTPRVLLTSVPYAQSAQHADVANVALASASGTGAALWHPEIRNDLLGLAKNYSIGPPGSAPAFEGRGEFCLLWNYVWGLAGNRNPPFTFEYARAVQDRIREIIEARGDSVGCDRSYCGGRCFFGEGSDERHGLLCASPPLDEFVESVRNGLHHLRVTVEEALAILQDPTARPFFQAEIVALEQSVASEILTLDDGGLIVTGNCAEVPDFTHVNWPYAEICDEQLQFPLLDSKSLRDEVERTHVYELALAEIAAARLGGASATSHNDMLAMAVQATGAIAKLAPVGASACVALSVNKNTLVLPIRNGVGKAFRDAMVSSGAFAGRHATYRRAWERLGAALEGLVKYWGPGATAVQEIRLDDDATAKLLELALLDAATQEAVDVMWDRLALRDSVFTSLLDGLRQQNATGAMLAELTRQAQTDASVRQFMVLGSTFVSTVGAIAEISGKLKVIGPAAALLGIPFQLYDLRNSVNDVSLLAQKASVEVTLARQVVNWAPQTLPDRETKAVFQGACLLAAYSNMIKEFDMWDSLRALQGFQEWLGSRLPGPLSAWSRWHAFLNIGGGDARPSFQHALGAVIRGAR